MSLIRSAGAALGLLALLLGSCSGPDLVQGPPPTYIPVPMGVANGYWLAVDADGDGLYTEADGTLEGAVPLYLDEYVGDYYGDTYSDGYYSYHYNYWDPFWSPWWDPWWYGPYGGWGPWPWWYWYWDCDDDNNGDDGSGSGGGSDGGDGGGGGGGDGGGGDGLPDPRKVKPKYVVQLDGSSEDDNPSGGAIGIKGSDGDIEITDDGAVIMITASGAASNGSGGGSGIGAGSKSSNDNSYGGRVYNAYTQPTASQRLRQPGGMNGRPTASQRVEQHSGFGGRATASERARQPLTWRSSTSTYGIRGTAEKHPAPPRPSNTLNRWDSSRNGSKGAEPKVNSHSRSRPSQQVRQQKSSSRPSQQVRQQKSSSRPSQQAQRPKSSARPSQQARPSSSGSRSRPSRGGGKRPR